MAQPGDDQHEYLEAFSSAPAATHTTQPVDLVLAWALLTAALAVTIEAVNDTWLEALGLGALLVALSAPLLVISRRAASIALQFWAIVFLATVTSLYYI